MAHRLRVAIALSAILVAFYIILADFNLFRRQTRQQIAIIMESTPMSAIVPRDTPNFTNTSTSLVNRAVKLFTPEATASITSRLGKGLNKHTWENDCLKTIEQLCNFPVFPNAPDRRSIVNSVNISGVIHNGHRFFGFLIPNSSGERYLAVASNGFAEVWLSPSENWKDAKRVARIYPYGIKTPLKKLDFRALQSQISDRIQLQAAKKYYFEVTYARYLESPKDSFIQVAWGVPGQLQPEIIVGEFFSPFVTDSHLSQRKIFDTNLPDALSCEELRGSYANKYLTSEDLPYLETKAVENTLPYCEYSPSYLLNPSTLGGFKRYSGVYKYALKTFSYPYTNVEGIGGNPPEQVFIAERPLEEQEARAVVNAYVDALAKTYPGTYQFVSIVRVEKKEDPENGGRYLVELKVKDLQRGMSYILSEYVYKPLGKDISSLCYPKGLQWNRTADVYLILTSKNLGRWVHHFIKNVEQIIWETKDPHLHVVIYDYNSPDIDLKQAFNQSSLTNYRFISQPGQYSRGYSFTEAIKSITDPNAIVVTIDLHLDIGSRLINDIRKHCVKGKTIYAPQIVFLHCGGSSARPSGYWYHNSYGTIAMYKEDWVKFGGFSTDFVKKATWGGEDWDIVDGAVKGGLEVERKRGPWVYHYYHSKAGMW